MDGDEAMKVCFIASSGGHLEQLMLLRPVMKKYESLIITENTKYNSNINHNKCYKVIQINRNEIFFLIKFIILFYQSIKIFVKEKPNVIISTGALCTIPILLIGKLFRKKIIFIESFSKISSPTMTGRIIYPIADVFVIQWIGLKKYYPKSLYWGGIY
jgi:beta-1,4-N-acetylglucosaminyltransferase